MARSLLVLGVDGGGTKTLGLVSDPLGNILARREVGATNPNVVGFDTSARHLFQLINECCEDIRCKPNELQAIVLALAGAGRKENQKRVKESVTGLFEKAGTKPPPLLVETDARAALEGAFRGGPGVIVIAGTGSIVTGKTPSGQIITVGGWGRILGDEGSGYAIGREALKALTLHLDARGDAGKLRTLLEQKLHLSTRDDIIGALYQDKLDIPSLAQLVIAAAADNDLASQRILQQAASQLADQVRVVVLRMGILRKVGLVFCGALIDHETVYSNVLHLKIIKMLPQVDIRPAMHPPAYGAVLMAIERLKKA
jgi:N-acetylglucosamine kinase-like BadF-type ATPase